MSRPVQMLKAKAPKLSEKDYALKKEQFLKKLEAVSRFADCTDSDKEERKRKGFEDAFYFARTYLPHRFETDSFAEYHPDLVATCQTENVPVVITGTRGGAKSTFVSYLEIIRDLCYNREELIVLAMNSLDRAELYTLEILTELQHNARIKEDFGEIVSMAAARGDFATRRTPERERTTRLMAWGDGMSMRGLMANNSRPSKVIVEDIQDRESAESPNRTKKLMHVVKADWFGALRNRNWKYLVIGNVICEGSLIDLLIKEDNGWVKRVYRAIEYDANGNRYSTWPEHYPLELLDEKRQQMGDADFEAEYLCEAKELNAKFQPEWFRHWADLPKPIKRSRMFIVLDPSISEVGDHKAMFVVYVHKHSVKREDFGILRDAAGKVYQEDLYHFILDAFNRQCSVEELFEKMFEWDTKYHHPWIYFDGTFQQREVVMRLIKPWFIKKNRRLRMRDYKCKTDKDRRIGALQANIQQGTIVFPRMEGECAEDVKETKRQFVRFGKSGVKKDGPDAIAAAVEKTDDWLTESSFS